MRVAENLVLGIDLGISTLGWALLDSVGHCIVDAGVWTFSAPETDKEQTPKNHIRQQARSARTVIRRRRQRMKDIRSLLFEFGLLPDKSKDIVGTLIADAKTNPWSLRAEGLTRRLTDREFAVCLYHIAKHRGFQSNRKGGDNAAAGEDQKALKAMEGLGNQIAQYKTFGEALFKDPDLSRHKRNTPNNYGRTPKRDWLRSEIRLLFGQQRKMGAAWASADLEDAFGALAFAQRDLQDQADRVRECPFEKGEKRASKHAPSFEKFRFLQKLAHLSLYEKGTHDWTFSQDEIQALESEFGKHAKFTFKTIRKLLDLSDNVRFRGVSKEDEAHDIATRKSSSAVGTRALRQALDGLYDSLSPEQRDAAMFAIAFHESAKSVAAALDAVGLPQNVQDALNKAVAENVFSDVKGAAHISAKACRAIITGLRTGAVYADACQLAGYDHTAPDASPLVQLRKEVAGLKPTEIRRRLAVMMSDPKQTLIGSPVARKAFIEAIKQFVALVNDHPALKGSLPGQVHVELARDVGKSAEERNKIKSGIDRRNRTLDKAAADFEDRFGRPSRRGSQDLLTFELAQEQGWKCLYTGEAIDPARLFDGQTYQIDHILPWSRFGDDSFINLTLCLARANQAKKNRTPYEWLVSGEAGVPSLDLFLAAVESCKEMRGMKKRNYTLKNAADVEDLFRNRNLNDTRWACKLFLQALELFYPAENESRRLFARPGGVTSKARKAWGLERFKKDAEGNRLEDDRHHALDAIAVAAISEALLQKLTLAHQLAEDKGAARPFERFDPPWPEFRDQVRAALEGILVARAEERRVSGQTHLDTIRGVDDPNEPQMVFERLSPEKLLDQVKKEAEKSDWRTALEKRFNKPERSQAIIQALLTWQENGRPADHPPAGPTGDKIEKIKVISTGKPAVMVRGGTADRGDMARVDVFSKPNAKGKTQYFLVPVYPHQVAADDVPPNRAVQQGCPEADWPMIDDTYRFEFSVMQKSWVEVVKSDGTVIEGYFRGVDRSTGNIGISPHLTLQQMTRGLGARTLHSFRKYQIGRLGTKHLITKEERTWRGEVFTSAKRPD